MAGTGDGLFVMINHFTNCGQHLITISQLYHYNKQIPQCTCNVQSNPVQIVENYLVCQCANVLR